MKATFSGVHLLVSAIESIKFDSEAQELVVRTVSGKEHRIDVDGEVKAQEVTENILCGVPFVLIS